MAVSRRNKRSGLVTVASFAEFFAGIGLVRLALEPLGWECAFANDISELKAAMYRDRYGGEHLKVTDVRGLEAHQIPSGVTLFTASFPCIDVSLAGNRHGLDGSHTGAFWPFARLLGEYAKRHAPPRAVLLENVVGLLTSNRGEDMARVVEALNQLGYRCDVVVVDARWFVPQSRPRVFVIALRGDDPRMSPSPERQPSRLRPAPVSRFVQAFPDLGLGRVEMPEPPLRSPGDLASILEDVPPDSPLWWTEDKTEALVSGMHPGHRARIASLARPGMPSVAALYRRVRRGRAVGEVRIDGLAGCLRTPTGGSSVQFLVLPQNGKAVIRRMTAREYARLQGVPDDFPIAAPDRQAMMGFGDAVCVPAVRWLARHALGHLLVDGGPPESKAARTAFVAGG